MIITLDKDAVSYDIVLATGANGAALPDATVTVNPANLQATVDFINDNISPADASGNGSTAHGYTATIVANGDSSVGGTIMLTKGDPTSVAQLTFPGTGPLVNQIDLGRIAIENNTSPNPVDMDVKTLPKALEAIEAVDSAIQTVNIQRSKPVSYTHLTLPTTPYV